jgi:hypothetical protein
VVKSVSQLTVLSAIIAVDKRVVRFGRGKGTEANASPGDVILFNSKNCHCGTGLKKDENARLAAFCFLAFEESDLGQDTFECFARSRVTLKKLQDGNCDLSRRLEKGEDEEGELHEDIGYDLIDKHFRCQLCSVFFERDEVKKCIIHQCKHCKVTLCAGVCWEFYHKGLGIHPNVTFEKYMKARKDCN